MARNGIAKQRARQGLGVSSVGTGGHLPLWCQKSRDKGLQKLQCYSQEGMRFEATQEAHRIEESFGSNPKRNEANQLGSKSITVLIL